MSLSRNNINGSIFLLEIGYMQSIITTSFCEKSMQKKEKKSAKKNKKTLDIGFESNRYKIREIKLTDCFVIKQFFSTFSRK